MIGEGVRVLEGDNLGVEDRLPVINKTIVVGESPENRGRDEAGGAKPAAAEMYVGDRTVPGVADVLDTHGVCWDPVW